MRPLRVAVLFAAAIALTLPLQAQQVDSAFKGTVLGRLAAREDSNFHFAAYIPRHYAADHPAPLLLVLDPRGRAEQSIELMVPAAERLGWIVLSSYDTRSDDPHAPNARAVNLMIADALSTFAVDTSRLYIAGFSGTARDAWVMAYGSNGHVVGIISADAAMPGDSSWRTDHLRVPPFDVAMSAASRGFNYFDVTLASDTLRALGAPVRTDEFTGDHAWSPEPVVAQAIGWLEARAMARKLRPMDPALVDSLYAVDSTAAAALETRGQTGEAVLAWQNAAIAWKGLHDVGAASARIAALTAQPAVKGWLSERDSLVHRMPAEQRALAEPLAALRRNPGVPDIRKLTQDLHVERLARWAADSADSVRAQWAVRALAGLYVEVSFYEPEAYLSVSDPDRALAVLTIAEEIHPGAPAVCHERARAYALRQDADRTLTELRCALAGHATTIAAIKADGRYGFLRTNDAFLDLLHIPR